MDPPWWPQHPNPKWSTVHRAQGCQYIEEKVYVGNPGKNFHIFLHTPTFSLINLSPLNLDRQAYLDFEENWAQWARFSVLLNHFQHYFWMRLDNQCSKLKLESRFHSFNPLGEWIQPIKMYFCICLASHFLYKRRGSQHLLSVFAGGDKVV